MSTSTWNPERRFPWLGDSLPCPTSEEEAAERFKRPIVTAPLIVWEYAMTLERLIVNAEERLAECERKLAAALAERDVDDDGTDSGTPDVRQRGTAVPSPSSRSASARVSGADTKADR